MKKLKSLKKEESKRFFLQSFRTKIRHKRWLRMIFLSHVKMLSWICNRYVTFPWFRIFPWKGKVSIFLEFLPPMYKLRQEVERVSPHKMVKSEHSPIGLKLTQNVRLDGKLSQKNFWFNPPPPSNPTRLK